MRHSGSFLTVVLRETATSSRALSPSIKRAPQHITDTDDWGVSDPAGRARGRRCDAEAGSLTPHLCSHFCAGALSGRHKAPPDTDDDDLSNVLLSMHLERALQGKNIGTDMRARCTRRH